MADGSLLSVTKYPSVVAIVLMNIVWHGSLLSVTKCHINSGYCSGECCVMVVYCQSLSAPSIVAIVLMNDAWQVLVY